MFRTTLALLKRETPALAPAPTPLSLLLADFEAAAPELRALLTKEAKQNGVPVGSYTAAVLQEAIVRNAKRDCITTTLKMAILAAEPSSLLVRPIFPKDERTGKRPSFDTSARHQYDVTIADETYKVNKMRGRLIYKLTKADGQVTLYVNCEPLL